MAQKEARIKQVMPGSIAEEAGIEAGDILRSVNRQSVGDVFDYRFLIADEELVLEVEKTEGELWEIEIEKDQYEDLGMEFEDSMMDEARSCTNQCIFCFIDQLPKGMRSTLYFKDDDSRLSFLNGNYVTLTNMGDAELDRIIRYRMSPINVSVHTTNPQLRTDMLHNRFAGNVMDKITRLVQEGITINCQIVLCRGVNDGLELDRTLSDLAALYPGIYSISVVPVGLTAHREGLYNLVPYDAAASRQVLEQTGKWQEKFLKDHGSRVVYLADEFYQMSGVEVPPFNQYEDFPQIENGVGLIAMLRHEFEAGLQEVKQEIDTPRTVSIASGVSAASVINELADKLVKRYNHLKVLVYPIENRFFGPHVTVTGLLTGQDIAEQLRSRRLGDELLICSCMLRSGEDVLLDDITVGELQQKLGVGIRVVDNDGKALIKGILGTE